MRCLETHSGLSGGKTTLSRLQPGCKASGRLGKKWYLAGQTKTDMGRKVIGVGETVLDIIFRDGQPQRANAGGSTFNTMVSLGRVGVEAALISETGDDEVGAIIRKALADNEVDASCARIYGGMKTKVAMAFLDGANDAHYAFYGGEPAERQPFLLPETHAEDVVVFGSYYALNPSNRSHILGFLNHARRRGAVVYYDINFRPSHAPELDALRPYIIENMAYADIVRASADDLDTAFGTRDAAEAYSRLVSKGCRNFICTDGAQAIRLFTGSSQLSFPVRKIPTVSTIGAGDSFNAGLVYGLLTGGVTRQGLSTLSDEGWAQLIEWGRRFSLECCQSLENYVSKAFAQGLREG